jgi:hypothetical protein
VYGEAGSAENPARIDRRLFRHDACTCCERLGWRTHIRRLPAHGAIAEI